MTGLLCCAALLATYAAVAWSAAGRMSPTFDEPYHALSAWVQLHRHDYRIDNEDPPGWQYWASLPNGRSALSADFADPHWQHMGGDINDQWVWLAKTLYRTPGNDPTRLITRARAMMLVVAVALGIGIAGWAWRLGGPVAAVVATAAFALDPNFLAHGPLMKNDVAASAAWLGVAWGLWDVGRRVTPGSVLRLLGLCAVPLCVKYSGLLIAILVPASLFIRAMIRTPWHVRGRPLATRGSRLLVAAALVGLVAATAVVTVWAEYGLRYRSGPALADRLDLSPLVERAVDNERLVHPSRTPPGPAVRAALFVADHHLLPQPFVAGFLFTYAESLVRPAYLLGQVSLTGWWYYFPFAMAVKAPVATLAAVGVVAVLAIRRRRRRRGAQPSDAATRWAVVSLALPVVIYLASAMSSNLNIGLRHVLPAYPPAFVALGCVAAAAVRRRPRAARRFVVALVTGLAFETAFAFPRYVNFFNAPARLASRDGHDLLGDSNLDWGQGLLALADWQRRHPADPLYLSYFGLTGPRSFGIRYTPIPGRMATDPIPPAFPDPRRPAWLAISISHLQLADTQPEPLRSWYRRWAARTPTQVVGGSIYIYRYDPAGLDAGRR